MTEHPLKLPSYLLPLSGNSNAKASPVWQEHRPPALGVLVPSTEDISEEWRGQGGRRLFCSPVPSRQAAQEVQGPLLWATNPHDGDGKDGASRRSMRNWEVTCAVENPTS